MINIKIQIETGLTWEEDDLLSSINTTLHNEVGGGKVTLYAEMEDDISIIPAEIKRVISKTKDIRRALA